MEDGARRLTTGSTRPRVAVIGAGWAGCAAAVTLADAGVDVTLVEQARAPGGRARRVAVQGRALDNGQHLLLGAYRATQAILARVGVDWERACLRLPLTLRPFGDRDAPSLTAPRLPAPLHLVAALASSRGLSWRERGALIAGFRRLARVRFVRPAGETVTACFATTPRRAFDALWEPLCLAALNTPPERASAQVFANVLRDAFTGRRADSDLLLPATDLSALLPDAAIAWLRARGATLLLGRRVRSLVVDSDGVNVDGDDRRFDAAIVATGPHQLAHLAVDGTARDAWQRVQASATRFGYEGITTVYLAFPMPALDVALMRLDDAPGQWVVDRGTGDARDGLRVLAVVISANGPHDAWDQVTLAARVEAQLRRLSPALPKAAWSRVIAERRATYACTPERPLLPAVVHPRLHLAGDHVDREYPATLEAAVRTGVAAASASIAHTRLRRDAGSGFALSNPR